MHLLAHMQGHQAQVHRETRVHIYSATSNQQDTPGQDGIVFRHVVRLDVSSEAFVSMYSC